MQICIRCYVDWHASSVGELAGCNIQFGLNQEEKIWGVGIGVGHITNQQMVMKTGSRTTPGFIINGSGPASAIVDISHQEHNLLDGVE